MTHIENIPHILLNGITHMHSPNRNPNYVPIGDGSLISNRDKFKLSNGQQLGSYIPFYFGTRMPMLFVIQKGFNNVKRVPVEDIIYCVSTIQEILDHKLDFIFSNGHAVDELTEFYSADHVNDILDKIDMSAIGAKYWTSETDLDLKRRKEAECLIHNDLPINSILGYVVYNALTKQKLIDIGIEEKKIVVRSNFYF